MNHPLWAKAIELMYPKANTMSKPRYWSVSYPLSVTLLCVAPHDYFIRNWTSCIETSVGKLKVSRDDDFPVALHPLNNRPYVGQNSSAGRTEWNLAYCVDISLPLPGAGVKHHDQIG